MESIDAMQTAMWHTWRYDSAARNLVWQQGSEFSRHTGNFAVSYKQIMGSSAPLVTSGIICVGKETFSLTWHLHKMDEYPAVLSPANGALSASTWNEDPFTKNGVDKELLQWICINYAQEKRLNTCCLHASSLDSICASTMYIYIQEIFRMFTQLIQTKDKWVIRGQGIVHSFPISKYIHVHIRMGFQDPIPMQKTLQVFCIGILLSLPRYACLAYVRQAMTQV